jgi:hypothetical protein
MDRWSLVEARRAGRAGPDDLTRERALRLSLEVLLDGHPCNCPCGEPPTACRCTRCAAWLENRLALEALGLFLEGFRPAVSIRAARISQPDALIEDLRRLVTEGGRGRNFLVVFRGDAFVQCVQFLEPHRDDYITVEVGPDAGVYTSGAADVLQELGFSPPSGTKPDLGEGDESLHELVYETSDDDHPCYWRRIDLPAAIEHVLPDIADLFVAVFEGVFGLVTDDSIELELHVEAGRRVAAS